MRSLSQWLKYLESIHPSAIDMGLKRVKTVADKLGLDLSAPTVLTVGGTNGKGTTCRFIESVLIHQGFSVATYRSPHLLDYRERVTLNGELPDEEAFVDAFEHIESTRDDITLTYFEFGTLAALWMMAQWQPDYVLLEVGLGGRLDATNIIDTDLAVITSIALDHQAFLGDTRESVAFEKAGIFRTHSPIVIGEPNPPIPLIEAASNNQTQVWYANQDFTFKDNGDVWSFYLGNEASGQQMSLEDIPYPLIPIENAATAMAALSMLPINIEVEAVHHACQQATLPGRRQQVRHNPDVVVDVGHNPHAAKALVNHLNRRFDANNTALHLVVGMLKDKAIAETLAPFAQYQGQWYLASTHGPRGLNSRELQACLLDSAEVARFESVVSAYKAALNNAKENDLILVFGSFLTVADVLAYHPELSV